MSAPDRTDFPLILALWAAGLGAAAQFAKISVLYDPLGGIYAGAGAAIGFMVSLVGLVGLVFGTTGGLLVRRIGPKRAMVGALVMGAAISLFQAALPPLWPMLASRLVEGISHLAIVIVGPTIIGGLATPRHQGLAMTLWSSFFGVSFALTAWAGLPLVAAFGVPALFLAHAAVMAVLAAVLARMLPPDPAPDRQDRLDPATLIRQHREIYASPRVAAPAMGFFFYTMMYVALLTLLPPLLGGRWQALVAGGMPLASIALSFTLGVWLLGRMPAVRAVQAGLAAGVAAMVALWLLWGSGWPAALLALALAGALGLVQGASFAAIPQLNASTEDRARAAGAVAQLGNLGTTSGTPVLAAIIAGQGVSGVLGFVLVFSLGGIAVHAWLAARRRRDLSG